MDVFGVENKNETLSTDSNWWDRFKAKLAERKANRPARKAEREANREERRDKRETEKLNGERAPTFMQSKGAQAGMTALTEAPKVISSLQYDPFDDEIDDFDTARQKAGAETDKGILQMATSGLSIGSTFGPYGAAAGLVLGAGAGVWNKIDKMDGFNEKWDDKVTQKWSEDEKRLMETWYNENDLQDMERTYNMLKQQR